MTDEQKRTVLRIVGKMSSLGHNLNFVEPVSSGPIVSTYRFVPKISSKLSQITALAEDLAMFLGVEDVVIRRLPGESVIGVTVPNDSRAIPMWRDALRAPDPHIYIPLNLGVDEHGKPFLDDLTVLPHLLVAGSTGSGKSVMLRSLAASLCFWRRPDQVQLVLSDTKQVEYGVLDGDPHLMFPRLTTVLDTLQAMEELIKIVEFRLKLFADYRVQNIKQFNELSTRRDSKPLPYFVFIIDELADFVGKSVDKEVHNIATSRLQHIVQRSRAAGIHCVASTQRPSVDIVTGSIKTNFPSRLSFRLPSEADSRTVLGHQGAEHLLSIGDCWYQSTNAPAVRRLHSYFATMEDITGCLQLASDRVRTSFPQLTHSYAKPN